MIIEKMKDPNRRTGNDVEDDIEAAIQREAEATSFPSCLCECAI